MSIRFDPSQVLQQLGAIERRHVAAATAYGDTVANKMVKYAKKNRPWTDRTHTAKNNITGESGATGSGVRVELHGNVYYHAFLEYRNFSHAGRLAIFWPTIAAIEPEALAGWAKVVST